MSSAITRAVLNLTDRGAHVALEGSAPEDAFWLPRGHVTWAKPPAVDTCVVATLPAWLASKHKQLDDEAVLEAMRDHQRPPVASVASDESRHANTIRKETDMSTMTGKPEDAGHGALFKNDKREKETHPLYKGDCTIRGTKYWVSAWLKEGKDGKKYMSLAFREADQQTTAKPKPTPAPVDDDSEVPF